MVDDTLDALDSQTQQQRSYARSVQACMYNDFHSLTRAPPVLVSALERTRYKLLRVPKYDDDDGDRNDGDDDTYICSTARSKVLVMVTGRSTLEFAVY